MQQFKNSVKNGIDNFKKWAYNQIERWHGELGNANEPVKEQPMQFPITVQPHQIPTPYELGFEDAQNGEPFAPEMYYMNPGQMRKYAEGFNVARPNAYAAAFLGHRNFVPAEV